MCVWSILSQGGAPQKFEWGCPLLETLTLFQTNIFDIPLPTSDLDLTSNKTNNGK